MQDPYVKLTLMFEREGNKWVATCLELGTSTYGRTLERVEESIRRLVIEHLDPPPLEFRIPVPAGHEPDDVQHQFYQPCIFPMPTVAVG